MPWHMRLRLRPLFFNTKIRVVQCLGPWKYPQELQTIVTFNRNSLFVYEKRVHFYGAFPLERLSREANYRTCKAKKD